jgi:ferredoxin
MSRSLRVSVDHDACVGNAACTRRAPGVFRLNEDMQSEVIDAAGADPDLILAAAENCPVSAIRVVDADTNETLFAGAGGSSGWAAASAVSG